MGVNRRAERDTLYYVIILGPAGSGKSHLVAALADWMEANQLDVARVNLDPAVEWLPYTPDVDARDYVDARKVMEEYQLGPNGAMIASVDLLIKHIDEIREEVEATKANYALIDTPGQMELFAFRETGPVVLSRLLGDARSVAVFLIDAAMTVRASSLASAVLLAGSVRFRLKLPQVNVVSKADLLSREAMEEVERLLNDPDYFYSRLVEERIDPMQAEAFARLLEALSPEGGSLEMAVRFVSAVSGFGLDDLYAVIQQVLVGGEDFYTEEPNPRL